MTQLSWQPNRTTQYLPSSAWGAAAEAIIASPVQQRVP